MRCFVAMAFAHSDTDRLYDETLAPLLLEMGIDAIRVDRVEHNDNIDDRIIAEIKAADLALVDLTYARPSVYFEAGYAERAIPVVYTIRGDHLAPRVDDPFGVFRLHFDLAMRNVVDWAAPDDEGFRVRLRRRLDHVLAPLRQADNDRQVHAQRVAAFRSKAETWRRERVNERLATALANRSFLTESGAQGPAGYQHDWGMESRFFRYRDGVYKHVSIGFYSDSPSSYYPPRPGPDPSGIGGYNLNIGGCLNATRLLREHLFVFAFKYIPPETLAGNTTQFDILDEGKDYLLKRELDVPILPPGFGGKVVIAEKDVPTSLVERLQTGKRWSRGYKTDNPPAGTTWTGPRTDAFVYEGFEWRPLRAETYIHLVNDIETAEDAIAHFAARLDCP